MDTHVTQALALWGMQDAPAALVAQRENHVYRVEHDGLAYALRIHRPGYRTTAELQSELDWCSYLADAGLHVPRPLAASDGALLHRVGDTHASVLHWLSGKPIGEGTDIDGDPVALAHRVGREMARLHDVTDRWSRPAGFTRPDWTLEALIGASPLWGDFHNHPDLSDADISVLETACAAARANADTLGQDIGLIHADLIAENLMLDGDKVGLLDFDDSAIGYRAFELSTFLVRYESRPDFTDLRAAIVDGYAARRRIPDAELDLILMLRAITYIGWIAVRRHEPGGQIRSQRMIARALRCANSYLNRRPI